MEFNVRPTGYNKHSVTLTDDSARKVLYTFAGSYATYFAAKYALLYSIRRFSTR